MSQELLNKIKILSSNYQYKKIRELIESSKIDKFRDKINREYAKAYYLDKELELNFSSKSALTVLSNIGEDTNPQETLRLRGAIYKRLWWKSNKSNDDYIDKSIENYRNAIGTDNKSKENDKGYATFNFAYLKLHKYKKVQNKKEREKFLKNIFIIIEDDLKFLENFELTTNKEKLDYWFFVTVAQLYCIKQNHSKTIEYLSKSEKFKKVPDREKAITFQHILDILHLTNYKSNEEFDSYLKSIFIDYHFTTDLSQDITCIRNSLTRGKLGIALSGGGFRASFFHIGILARLSELDMLRSIETISAVSGGSIIAMHYYLKLKNKLESQISLSHQDYIDLIEELKNEFLTAIQKNIRVKSFTSVKKNIKIVLSDLFDEDYTRTSYLGELYSEIIYKEKKDLNMKDIKIYPLGKDGKKLDNFHPYYDNFYRSSKVPNLIINSTNLNSGHNWRITASGMGELESMINSKIDKNKLYKYQKYDDFKSLNLKNFKVSDAIASSSAVPGLFEPIVIDTKIKNEKIKISDGGVYDNQGLQSLLDDNCEMIICSDPSGYFEDDSNPSSSKSKIFMRMTDNLMDVTRNFQYKEIERNLENNILRGFEYFHLKKELPSNKINLKENTEYIHELNEITSYKVNESIQNKLAQIRTDLDSFTEIEYSSLLTSAYNMSYYSNEFKTTNWKKFQSSEIKNNWDFLASVQHIMGLKLNENSKTDNLNTRLENSKKILFKVLKFKNISFIYIILPLIVVLFLIYKIELELFDIPLNSEKLTILLLSTIFPITIFYLIFNKKSRFLNLCINLFLGTIGWLGSKYYIKFLNKKFNEEGKTDKL